MPKLNSCGGNSRRAPQVVTERRARLSQELDDEVKYTRITSGHLLQADDRLQPLAVGPVAVRPGANPRHDRPGRAGPTRPRRFARSSRNAWRRRESIVWTVGSARTRTRRNLETMCESRRGQFPHPRKPPQEDPRTADGPRTPSPILKAAQQQAYAAAASQTLVQTLLEAIPNDSLKARTSAKKRRERPGVSGAGDEPLARRRVVGRNSVVYPKPAAIEERDQSPVGDRPAGKRDQQKPQFSSRQENA